MSYQIKFYNAGDRIVSMMPFSIDGADNAYLAKWRLDAPAKSFFLVPTTLAVKNGGEIAVTFAKDIVRKYSEHGVVQIDPNYPGNIPAGVGIAKTETEAQEKGEELWSIYLDRVIRRWYAQVADTRAGNGMQREASGFVLRALKLRGMRDPAAAEREAAMAAAQTGNHSNSEVSKLTEMVLTLTQRLNDMTQSAKVKAEVETANVQNASVDTFFDAPQVAEKARPAVKTSLKS